MKKILILSAIVLANQMQAQKSCFDLRIWRSIADTIKGPDFIDTIIQKGNVFIEKFKGCDFPEKQLNNVNGDNFSISELLGNLVVVNFWFIGCPPCEAEIPEINNLAKQYSQTHVKFLNITFEEKNKLTSFLEKNPMPGIIQTYQTREYLEDNFCNVFGYPMCFVLDKNAKVLAGWTGGLDSEQFKKKITTLLDDNL